MKYKKYKKNYFSFIYEISLFPLYLLSDLLQYQFLKFIRMNNARFEHISYWQNRFLRVVGNLENNRRVSFFLLKRIRSEKFRQKIVAGYYKEMTKLFVYMKNVSQYNLKKKSNGRIWQYLRNFAEKYQKMYLWGWMPNGLEGHDLLFSEYLKTELKKRLKPLNKIKLVNEYFSTLVTSGRLIPRERQEIALLRIVIKIAGQNKLRKIFLNLTAAKIEPVIKKEFPVINVEISRHQKQYAWLMFKYEGPAWDKTYLISLIKEYLKDKVSPDDKLKRIFENKLEIKNLQKKYMAELKIGISEELYQYLIFAQELMYLKEHQKDFLFQVYYFLDPLVQEASARLHLSSVQFRHFLVPDMKEALLADEYDPDLLNERIKNGLLIYGKSKIARVAIGKEAEKIAKIMFPPLPKLKVFYGDCAAPGRVVSKVKVIQETKDINKMKKGDILVTTRSNPNLLPALRLASAIVADIGGVTSHAAIIARELKIPAVVGVKFASMILKDGDLVEVDANKGIVRKL